MVVAPRCCNGAVGRLPRMGSDDKLSVVGLAALPAPHRHDEGRIGRRLAILSGRQMGALRGSAPRCALGSSQNRMRRGGGSRFLRF